jgi:DNA-directed RNA polymerase II subunit RPB1
MNNTEEFAEIIGIEFGIFSPDEIRRSSVVHVEFPETFENTNTTKPKIKGLTDPHLGPIEPFVQCESCGLEQEECWGHFGHIELVRPIYHPSFVSTILKILRCCCHVCGRLLIYPGDIPDKCELSEIEKIIKNKKTKYSVCGTVGNNASAAGDKSDAAYLKWCQEGCKAKQLIYKKDSYDIVYKEQPTKEDKKDKKGTTVANKKTKNVSEEEDVKDGGEKQQKEDGVEPDASLFTAERALTVLEKITNHDAKLLGFKHPTRCKPAWMVMTVIPLPPPTVRPSVLMEASKPSEDDLTFKLAEIIKANNNAKKQEQRGITADKMQELLSILQYHYATYIANDFPKKGSSQQRSNRPIKCLLERQTGKQGRFRTNLMGKRGDQSARTVVGPDPSLSIEELGMPVSIATTLSFPEPVNMRNMHVMYQLIQNGPTKHPGARIVQKKDGTSINLNFCTDSIKLEVGDVVERHLIDGDVVINNRQPSLHKMSMMGHKVRVMPYSTFRMNLAVTTPYNADFDGDEMNVHVPQSYEARAEIENLLMVPYQVISPKNSGPVIGIIQDALLGSFKLTHKTVFVTRSFLMQICMQIDDFNGILPVPAIMKPVPLWTGKQVVSLIIPKTLYMKKKNNTFNNKKEDDPWQQIEKDTLVMIERGELVSGVMDKKTLGISSGSIIHIIYKDYGPEICRKFLNQIQFIANYWLLHFGFSVGISDCILGKNDQAYIQDTINRATNTVDEILKTEVYDTKLEEKINKILNAAGTDVGTYVKDNLPYTNCLGEMVNGGSKGNALNLVQMMGLVGQQNVMGKRIPLSYSGRSVPHVKMGDQGPQARGFVTNPYYDGLTPLELLFHTMGGREGLVDTAIKVKTTILFIFFTIFYFY